MENKSDPFFGKMEKINLSPFFRGYGVQISVATRLRPGSLRPDPWMR